MSEPVSYASLPPTPMMQSVGLSFGSLVEWARKAVNLLQTTGDTFVDLLEDGFRMWQAISSRDLSGILAAFASGKDNVEIIITAIRNEFQF
jgi:phage-related protein